MCLGVILINLLFTTFHSHIIYQHFYQYTQCLHLVRPRNAYVPGFVLVCACKEYGWQYENTVYVML